MSVADTDKPAPIASATTWPPNFWDANRDSRRRRTKRAQAEYRPPSEVSAAARVDREELDALWALQTRVFTTDRE